MATYWTRYTSSISGQGDCGTAVWQRQCVWAQTSCCTGTSTTITVQTSGATGWNTPWYIVDNTAATATSTTIPQQGTFQPTQVLQPDPLPQLTPEQIQQQQRQREEQQRQLEERLEQQRKQREEYAKQRQIAVERGEQLLKQWLSPEEYNYLQERNELEIPSKLEPDTIYIVKKDPYAMVDVKKKNKDKVDHRLCLHTTSGDFVNGDALLTKLLLLKADEQQFLLIANKHPPLY